MRFFPFITVGKILEEIWEERREAGASEDDLWYTDKQGKRKKRLVPARAQFYRLEERLNLPKPHKTSGELEWRVYERSEADEVKEKIKKEYKFS